jgi:hypothetical protein
MGATGMKGGFRGAFGATGAYRLAGTDLDPTESMKRALLSTVDYLLANGKVERLARSVETMSSGSRRRSATSSTRTSSARPTCAYSIRWRGSAPTDGSLLFSDKFTF